MSFYVCLKVKLKKVWFKTCFIRNLTSFTYLGMWCKSSRYHSQEYESLKHEINKRKLFCNMLFWLDVCSVIGKCDVKISHAGEKWYISNLLSQFLTFRNPLPVYHTAISIHQPMEYESFKHGITLKKWNMKFLL